MLSKWKHTALCIANAKIYISDTPDPCERKVGYTIDVFGKKYGSYIIIRPGEESPAIDEMFDLAFETLLEVLKHPLKARGG